MGTSSIVLAFNGERVRIPQSYSPSHRLIDVLRSETRCTVGCGKGAQLQPAHLLITISPLRQGCNSNCRKVYTDV
jgi:hypothetical protein